MISSTGVSEGPNGNREKTGLASNLQEKQRHPRAPSVPSHQLSTLPHLPKKPAYPTLLPTAQAGQQKPLSGETDWPKERITLATSGSVPQTVPVLFPNGETQHLKACPCTWGVSNQPTHNYEKTAKNQQVFGEMLLTSKTKTKAGMMRTRTQKRGTTQDTKENVYVTEMCTRKSIKKNFF